MGKSSVSGNSRFLISGVEMKYENQIGWRKLYQENTPNTIYNNSNKNSLLKSKRAHGEDQPQTCNTFYWNKLRKPTFAIERRTHIF